MKVREWMAEHPVTLTTLPEDEPPREVAHRMFRDHHVRDLYVVDAAGRIVGHIDFTYLARLVLGAHRPRHSRRELLHHVAPGPARELMSRNFAIAAPGEELDDVLARMLDHGVQDLPVTDAEGRLLGAISINDVLRDFVRAWLAPTNGPAPKE